MIPKLFYPLLLAIAFHSLMAESTPTNAKKFPPKGPTPYLSPEGELKTIKLKDGYYLELVLAEPHIKEPVIAVFDGNGNMYVAEMRTYMQDADNTTQYEHTSRVSFHQDTNGDGKFDKHTVFADNLLLPRIVLPLDNRVIIGETNTLDLYCYEDTDGDGVADKKELWFKGGPRGGNMEHQPSGLIWAMDNWLYTTYNNYRLRFTDGKVVKEEMSGGGGQWGMTQDNDGKPWFVHAGSEKGPHQFQWPIHYGPSEKRDQFEGLYQIVWPIDNIPDVQGGTRRIREDNTLNHFTATCGQAIYRGDRLPEDLKGDLLFSEPVGRLIRRTKITEKDGFTYLRNPYEKEKSEFILSTDANFRVVNMDTAPDGTLYMVDMYRGIIQEGNWVKPGSYLRKVVEQYELDKNISRGRIWRLRHKDFKPGPQPKMLQEKPAQLVKHLEHPNGWWRDTAQKLLILKGDKTVKGTLVNLLNTGKTTEARLHALWTLEGLDLLTKEIVAKALLQKEIRIQKAALRAAESLYKKGDKSLGDLIKKKIDNSDINVQFQAVLSARYLGIHGWTDTLEATTSNLDNKGFAHLKNIVLKKIKTRPYRSFNEQESTLLKKGKIIYDQLCASCHGRKAEGQITNKVMMAPPLAHSPRILGPKELAVNIVAHGLTGPIDGKTYPGGIMVPMGSNGNEWLAAVLSHVRATFGNRASLVSVKEVEKIRQKNANRKTPWTIKELEDKYPSGLLTNRRQWKLTASHNSNSLRYAIDPKTITRYDTRKGQEPGMWLQIELPKTTLLSGVRMDNERSIRDQPAGYEVSLSENGKTWSQPIRGNQGNGVDTVLETTFPPVKARFIRITLTKSKPRLFWSIHDLQILGKEL